MKISVYNLDIEKVKDIEISSRIFGRKIKKEVVHQVVIAQQANNRPVLAHTKERSEVRGGGRKPWRQKGTGRARHGSIRSPLWTGGGVTFGPTKERNFSKGVNKKQRQLALAMCLSDKINEKKMIVFEQIKLKSGKTKDLENLLKKIREKISDLKDSKRLLMILDKNDKIIIRAAANLKNIKIILADSLNCVDILKANAILVSKKAIDKIDKHYKKISEIKKNNI